MIACADCKLNNTEECDIMACDALDDLIDELNKRLIDCKEEINDINKILDYCSNWTDRLEIEMNGYLHYNNCGRGMDVIGEEFAIIDKMVTFCNKRMGELDVELNDIRGWLSRYNHGDYKEGDE